MTYKYFYSIYKIPNWYPFKNILQDLRSGVWCIYILPPCVKEMLMTSYSTYFQSGREKGRKRTSRSAETFVQACTAGGICPCAERGAASEGSRLSAPSEPHSWGGSEGQALPEWLLWLSIFNHSYCRESLGNSAVLSEPLRGKR